jgi:ectoine hydroxylase-related dioxygenase (phytanoyl-CoA dioxygenase family)
MNEGGSDGINERMNAALVAEYRRCGHVVARGVLAGQSSAEIFAAFKTAILRFSPSSRDALSGATTWSDPTLSALLIAMREREPNVFSAIYDTMQTSLAVQRFVFSDAVVKPAAILLDNEQIEGLCATGVVIRMDPPRDRRNVLEWHQDAAYYPQNQLGENGIVVWVPLSTITPDMGSIVTCSGSHRAQLHHVGRASRELHSDVLRISDDVASRYEIQSVNVQEGDAVFMNMATIHRSGDNISNKMRFVALVRFHRVRTDDFCPGLIRFVPNKVVHEAVLEKYSRSSSRGDEPPK